MSTMSAGYRGKTRRLVIAFDVGTTFSGLSYCLLDPEEVPKICSVTRYPGQEHASGSSKIPSVLFYDIQGTVRAAGAETELSDNVEKAEDEEWLKVEWFKVRMRPNSMPSALQLSSLPPLPPSKTVIEVFGDFLAYLMSCAERFIKDTHATVSRSWTEMRQSAIFIVGHPNGWEGSQQAKIRNAAIHARLVPDTSEGRSRVHFVTEGEASLHYCLRGGFVDSMSKGFIVADLGGGTLDFSAYKVTGTHPLRAEEVSPAKCDLEGSTMVTLRAKGFVKHKLRNSRFGSDDHIKQISDKFDETTKKTFRSINDVCLVAFGSVAEKDLQNNIRSGKLKLSGDEVASFFEPSITATVQSIQSQISEAGVSISTIYLVGGFSANPYLMSQLRERLAKHGLTVTIPDGQTSKAVAEGALSFYLDHFVTSRIAKVSYGTRYSYFYAPENREHLKRKCNVWSRPSGQLMISGGFMTVLQRGTAIESDKEYKQHYGAEISNLHQLATQDLEIYAYMGDGKPPEWEDQVPDKKLLKSLCVVSADLSKLRNGLQPSYSGNNIRYYSYQYDIVISFGGTELKAQISWMENGAKRWSPAQILYVDKRLEDNEQVSRRAEEQEEKELRDRTKQDGIPAIDRWFRRLKF